MAADGFLIERGIPVPPDSHRTRNAAKGGRPPRLPWHSLEPGDSVLVQTHDAAMAGQQWARRNARAFVIAKQHGTGWRVWRKK